MLIVKNYNDRIDELIIEFEENIGLKLPGMYRNFLKKYNGGETPNTSINSKGISSDVRVFYGLGTVKYNFTKIECIKEVDKFLLPIAEDSFGNVFAIDLGKDDKIYFIDHEKKNEIFLIEESFLEFINKCKSKEISESSRRTPEEREQILIKNGKGANISDGLRKMWQAEYEKYKNLFQDEVIL